VQFHLELGEADEQGHFYALAWCDVLYLVSKTPEANRLGLYWSPCEGLPRFSFHAFNTNGDLGSYFSGPDYSELIEAALLQASVALSIPSWIWRLHPQPSDRDFASQNHVGGYATARRELCLALFPLRVNARTNYELQAGEFFGPPDGGFVPPDINCESNEEYDEMLAASVEAYEARERSPTNR